MTANADATRAFDVLRVHAASAATGEPDELAVEEPLEIRVSHVQNLVRIESTVSVTMRTPGHDLELALGFLWTEGVLRDVGAVASLRHCGPPVREDGTSNIVKIELASSAHLDIARLERNFYTSSSCGVCGKTSLDAVRAASPPELSPEGPVVARGTLLRLPATLRAEQAAFARTGGLHAAALFSPEGALWVLREDVGRHNAVDKLVGAELLAGAVPCEGRVLLVSGRASFELVQKALMAGIPHLYAIGAPSSLAVDLARACGMTLVGFLRDGRFNVYSGRQRLLLDGV